MKTNKIRAASGFILAFLFFVSCSTNPKGSLDQRLQNVLDSGIEKYGGTGVSAAIIFPDEKNWTGTSGISYDTLSIKPDMLFAIGSITKNFVATLTLRLVEEGKLSLDDPISKWLPTYPHIDSTITIRQLLNHTSGIYMFWSNQKIWDDLKNDRNKIWTPEEVLTYIKEPYFDPGKGFRYSNTNYLLLAMIINKATDSALSANLRNYFWQPLNIRSARLSIEENIPDNLAHVYGDNFDNDGSYRDVTYLPRASHESITYGSAGIFMTASDLAFWCQSLFEGRVLNQQSMDEMFHFVDARQGGNMTKYGLGVQLYKKKLSTGEKAIGHAGANIGTSAYMMYLPKDHLSIVVMLNSMNHRCTEAIARNLIKVSLKELNHYSFIKTYLFDLFPYSIFITLFVLYWLVFFLVLRRRKRKRIQHTVR